MKIGFIICIVLLFSFSCSKDQESETGTLNMQFNLQYKGANVNNPEIWFDLNDSVDVRFTKVSLYLSDITLIGSTDLMITDIIHLSYLQTILGDAISTHQIVLPFSNLPVVQYTGIQFGLGVNQVKNNTKPADYTSGQPLSFNSEYWTPWSSYIFSKIEGEYRINQGSVESFVLHTGADEAYQEVNIDKTLVIQADTERFVSLNIDLFEILNNYPLTLQPRIHQLEQQEFVNMLAENFANTLRQ